MVENIMKGEITLFIVNLLYPHNLGFETHGNFLSPVYLTLEDAIKYHSNHTVIKLHQTNDGKQEIEVVYNGKLHKL